MRPLTIMQAKELQSSEAWQGVLAEIEDRTRVCYAQMTSCKSEDLLKYQAKLQVYQEMKGILQAVIEREE